MASEQQNSPPELINNNNGQAGQQRSKLMTPEISIPTLLAISSTYVLYVISRGLPLYLEAPKRFGQSCGFITIVACLVFYVKNTIKDQSVWKTIFNYLFLFLLIVTMGLSIGHWFFMVKVNCPVKDDHKLHHLLYCLSPMNIVLQVVFNISLLYTFVAGLFDAGLIGWYETLSFGAIKSKIKWAFSNVACSKINHLVFNQPFSFPSLAVHLVEPEAAMNTSDKTPPAQLGSPPQLPVNPPQFNRQPYSATPVRPAPPVPPPPPPAQYQYQRSPDQQYTGIPVRPAPPVPSKRSPPPRPPPPTQYPKLQTSPVRFPQEPQEAQNHENKSARSNATPVERSGQGSFGRKSERQTGGVEVKTESISALEQEQSRTEQQPRDRATNLANWKNTKTIVTGHPEESPNSFTYYLFLGIFLLVLLFLVITVILAKSKKWKIHMKPTTYPCVILYTRVL